MIQFHSIMLNILPEMGRILIITNCSQNQGSLLKSQRKFVHIKLIKNHKDIFKQDLAFLSSAFSEKTTNIWKNLPLVLTNQLIYLVNIKTRGRFFSNFVAFSQCLNFMQNIGGGSISIQISMATPKLPFSSIH